MSEVEQSKFVVWLGGWVSEVEQLKFVVYQSQLLQAFQHAFLNQELLT